MTDRKANFERAIAEYDEKALAKAVDFDKHGFVTVERDGVVAEYYVKGHRTLRAACDHLARAVEEGEPYVPEFVLDLDQDRRIEIDIVAAVVPKSVEAVQLVVPRDWALTIRVALAEPSYNTTAHHPQIVNTIDQALKRRS